MPVSSFGPRSAIDTWCQMCSPTPRVSTPSKRDSSASIASNNGAMLRHTVRQLAPSCRAIPATEACSRPTCRIAHQHARLVNSARGGASCSFCSVKVPTGQEGSGHLQVRFRHNSRTGRPNAGVSTKPCIRRP